MPRPKRRQTDLPEATELRIIGGSLRGRKLRYEPFMDGADPVTRPMKHRVREAIFNLVSTECTGKHAFDLFAGTGALGLEALSRGAGRATFIEKHVPTARVVQENIDALGVSERGELLATSAFLWGKRDLPQLDSSAAAPWLVFCSPPYAFFVGRQGEMLELIEAVIERAPSGSIVIVEADERFDFAALPGKVAAERRDEGWQVRTYPPAVVGVWRKS